MSVVGIAVLEDDEDGNLGDISVTNDADVCTRLCVGFLTIIVQRRELSIQVPHKTGEVIRLSLQEVYMLKVAEVTEGRIAALEATKVEILEKVRDMEDNARGLSDESHHLEHKLVVLNNDKERREAGCSEHTKAVTDAKVGPGNVKEPMRVLEERRSPDRSLLPSNNKYRGL